MILILASEDSSEAQWVSQILANRGMSPWWFDTSWFPSRASLTAQLTSFGWHGTITTSRSVIDLQAVSAVYYQQSQPFTFPVGLSEPELRFATIETRFGLGGLLSSLSARWVSHPSNVADAEYRITQMTAATAVGLAVPASILTNEVTPAKQFIETQDSGAVYKTIMHKIVSEESLVKLIHTTRVDSCTIDRRISLAPHLLQHNVDKAFDARIIVTSRGTCLGVAIRTDDSAARQDWTTRYDRLTYEPVKVPDEVARKCREFLAALHIEVGVFDFSVDSAGTWWFLEVNPCGAWAWLAEETGLPVAEAVADLLTEDNTPCPV
ncbi:ATP-grasp ribosomal peptide maturase [Streptosporangium violaceochromogenes]|nr:ATP-grasp ribosomal peptide maturase [Streptosporangium violaceochromogenes]